MSDELFVLNGLLGLQFLRGTFLADGSLAVACSVFCKD